MATPSTPPTTPTTAPAPATLAPTDVVGGQNLSARIAQLEQAAERNNAFGRIVLDLLQHLIAIAQGEASQGKPAARQWGQLKRVLQEHAADLGIAERPVPAGVLRAPTLNSGVAPKATQRLPVRDVYAARRFARGPAGAAPARAPLAEPATPRVMGRAVGAAPRATAKPVTRRPPAAPTAAARPPLPALGPSDAPEVDAATLALPHAPLAVNILGRFDLTRLTPAQYKSAIEALASRLEAGPHNLSNDEVGGILAGALKG